MIDADKNARGPIAPITEIQAHNSPVKVLIVRTNEELEIAIQTKEVLQ
jgi:acetate kinase